MPVVVALVRHGVSHPPCASLLTVSAVIVVAVVAVMVVVVLEVLISVVIVVEYISIRMVVYDVLL